jgi:hypothetical protein
MPLGISEDVGKELWAKIDIDDDMPVASTRTSRRSSTLLAPNCGTPRTGGSS